MVPLPITISCAVESFNESVSPSDAIQSEDLQSIFQAKLTATSSIIFWLLLLLQGLICLFPTCCIMAVCGSFKGSWPSSQALSMLGLDTSNAYQCALCPASSLDLLDHHATTCKKGDVVTRHNQLHKDFNVRIVRLLQSDGFNTAHFAIQFKPLLMSPLV